MLIECDDFRIRSYRPDDIEGIARHANNPHVAETLRDRFPFPYTWEDAEEWIGAALQQEVETHFAIDADGGLIGTIGMKLGEDVYRQSAEIGYWVSEDYWNRGITTRAVRALTDWGFAEFDIIRMFAYVFESNPASSRVLEKAGFELEGRMRCAVIKQGRLMDQLLYGRLAPGVEKGDGIPGRGAGDISGEVSG